MQNIGSEECDCRGSSKECDCKMRCLKKRIIYYNKHAKHVLLQTVETICPSNIFLRLVPIKGVGFRRGGLSTILTGLSTILIGLSTILIGLSTVCPRSCCCLLFLKKNVHGSNLFSSSVQATCEGRVNYYGTEMYCAAKYCYCR